MARWAEKNDHQLATVPSPKGMAKAELRSVVLRLWQNLPIPVCESSYWKAACRLDGRFCRSRPPLGAFSQFRQSARGFSLKTPLGGQRIGFYKPPRNHFSIRHPSRELWVSHRSGWHVGGLSPRFLTSTEQWRWRHPIWASRFCRVRFSVASGGVAVRARSVRRGLRISPRSSRCHAAHGPVLC